MNCIDYKVKEGNTGILYLLDQSGNTRIYQPNCDLDKTQKYLYQFHDLATYNNKSINESFIIDNVDWYPPSVSMLYWQFFFQYVKYEILIEDWRNGKISFSNIEQGRFKKILKLLGYQKSNKKLSVENILRKSLSKLIMIRNKIVVKSGSKKILFLRPSLNDFRTNEILENLQKEFPVVQLIPFPRKNLTHIIFDSSICILPVSCNSFGDTDILEVEISDKESWIYEYAVMYAKEITSKNIASYSLFNKYIVRSEYKLFVGLDDCNSPYPYIYAAQDNGIECVGIQHGVYARRHEAYVMHGLIGHRWFDYLLVWGDYWKKIFLDNNKIFSPINVLIASNKHNYDYTILPKTSKSRSILIPYEFLADTIAVGVYLKVFYANNFDIYFKTRSDEDIEAQIKAYSLGDIENKLIIIDEITPEIMSNIDIVAGTQTTLLYDLLLYHKPLWILETPFKLLEDMVEHGLARKITLKDLNSIDKIYNSDIKTNRCIDSGYIEGSKSVSDVIKLLELNK